MALLDASGVEGTESRRYMGPLPALGQWFRLEVPASQPPALLRALQHFEGQPGRPEDPAEGLHGPVAPALMAAEISRRMVGRVAVGKISGGGVVPRPRSRRTRPARAQHAPR